MNENNEPNELATEHRKCFPSCNDVRPIIPKSVPRHTETICGTTKLSCLFPRTDRQQILRRKNRKKNSTRFLHSSRRIVIPSFGIVCALVATLLLQRYKTRPILPTIFFSFKETSRRSTWKRQLLGWVFDCSGVCCSGRSFTLGSILLSFMCKYTTETTIGCKSIRKRFR